MFVTVFGDRRVALHPGWTNEKIVSLVGDVRIDVATPGPDAKLTLMGIVGDAALSVPPGTRVTVDGFTLIGDRKVNTLPGEGAEIRVSTYGLVGDLKVTEKTAN